VVIAPAIPAVLAMRLCKMAPVETLDRGASGGFICLDRYLHWRAWAEQRRASQGHLWITPPLPA
jgi:hypothetical protein